MEVVTTEQWSESLWSEAEPIYYAAFPEHGRKKREIIRNMFSKQLCVLHLVKIEDQPVAMALTGNTEHSPALIIDYFAVREDQRGKGVGTLFLESIQRWAKAQGTYKLLLIEVEAQDNQTNQKRAQFWANVGFIETAYVHQYIWVPEPYRAMYLPLGNGPFSTEGEHLFSYITRFHKESFTKTQT
ncbi:GNAT family N-acetyltransferase [Brevibacillus choshinensis]|uniref:GNAT family N-acetyltransferase n=1 Tax=Brevibacillus choshinensis TaxID=54911 RepID=A0ABX7FVE0_BRECH|nr:GNAT family N-acetyltransferase [Brevibacillus choshinensis]QRG70218.1 GNAT family N-acetyltransferase [Brevibacillus choshinensis]